MIDFIKYIFQQIVSKPEAIEIDELQTEDANTYSVSLDKEDIPLVIGKLGRNIKSIRSLVKVKALKLGLNKQIYIDIKE